MSSVLRDWVALALRSCGYAADFSIDSLKEIDRFFDEHVHDGEAVPGGCLRNSSGSGFSPWVLMWERS